MTASELYDIVSAPHWATCWPEGVDYREGQWCIGVVEIYPAHAALMFEASAIRTLIEREGCMELHHPDGTVGTVILWLLKSKLHRGPTLLHALDSALKAVTA